MKQHLAFLTQYVVLFGVEGALVYALSHLAAKVLAKFKT
jgi:hypothetical protein